MNFTITEEMEAKGMDTVLFATGFYWYTVGHNDDIHGPYDTELEAQEEALSVWEAWAESHDVCTDSW